MYDLLLNLCGLHILFDKNKNTKQQLTNELEKTFPSNQDDNISFENLHF